MKEYPVYLFTGFLEDGKTSFINETLSNDSFKIGGNTLVLMCEDGEISPSQSKFASPSTIVYFNDIGELSTNALEALAKKHNPIRIIVEYNGMWEIDAFYKAMPADWFVFQFICIANAKTYPAYLKIMRQLCFDKLQGCEVIMFNRCSEGTDKAALRTAVRSVSRTTDIVYENIDGSIDTDNAPYELPYDKSLEEITIKDEEFGVFYLDIMDNPTDYENKIIKLKAYVCKTDKAEKGCFVAGRFAMACCAEDITFIGLLCEGEGAQQLEHRTWVNISARVELRLDKQIYDGEGPWLVNAQFSAAEKPTKELVSYSSI